MIDDDDDDDEIKKIINIFMEIKILLDLLWDLTKIVLIYV